MNCVNQVREISFREIYFIHDRSNDFSFAITYEDVRRVSTKGENLNLMSLVL